LIGSGGLYKGFNPRTREGCDTDQAGSADPGPGFNPRTREGCDWLSGSCCLSISLFQSTHPRGVRLDTSAPVSSAQAVSIHAPARGATPNDNEYYIKTLVSIHAPARGATRFNSTKAVDMACFNPRTREGCDPLLNGHIIIAQSVSIHAPARGATLCTGDYWVDTSVSIHAPARGATSWMYQQRS